MMKKKILMGTKTVCVILLFSFSVYHHLSVSIITLFCLFCMYFSMFELNLSTKSKANAGVKNPGA